MVELEDHRTSSSRTDVHEAMAALRPALAARRVPASVYVGNGHPLPGFTRLKGAPLQ